MTDSLEFRPLETAADWAVATECRNANAPSNPTTPEEAREGAERRAQFGGFVNGLVYDGEEPIAQAGTLQAFWSENEAYFVFAYPRPEAATRFGEVLQIAEEIACGRGARTLQAHGRSDVPWSVVTPPRMGYRVTQTNRALRLDLENWSPDGRGSIPDGFEIVSYHELAERRPDAWERDVWRLEMDVMADVPLPEPFQDIPFERFQAELRNPYRNLDALFAVLEGEVLAGLSQLLPNRADPTLASTGLTGVRRPYRRLGLARALKVHALGWARSNGLRRVFTDTEQSNPMGRLNLDLGFEFDHELVLFAKDVAMGEPPCR